MQVRTLLTFHLLNSPAQTFPRLLVLIPSFNSHLSTESEAALLVCCEHDQHWIQAAVANAAGTNYMIQMYAEC
jgi:hypothetical protein